MAIAKKLAFSFFQYLHYFIIEGLQQISMTSEGGQVLIKLLQSSYLVPGYDLSSWQLEELFLVQNAQLENSFALVTDFFEFIVFTLIFFILAV